VYNSTDITLNAVIVIIIIIITILMYFFITLLNMSGTVDNT